MVDRRAAKRGGGKERTMAGSFNKVILMGNLVKDPELRYTPQGTAVTDISLAINDNRSKATQGQDRNANTTFVDVTIWERPAEIICEFMRKGRPILIEGRLVMDSWDDRETGKKMRKLKVVATSFQFVDSGRGDGEGAPSGGGEGGYGGGAPRSGGNYGGGAARGGRPAEGGQGGGYSRPAQRPAAEDDFGGFPSGGGASGGDDIPF